ncbi:MAG: hypothetical protein FJ027_24175, partial [Candidatus Rokubacteria bacterium]|nr:hypothetical protein [Candidatus Rokubacteria bacterium]
AALEADTLERFTRRFRVAAIVALDEDAPSLGILHDTARWRRLARPPFLVFITTEPPMPARRVSRGAWDVTVDGPGWTSTSLAYYPLWRASLEGAPVSRRRGDAGDLEVRTGRDGAAVVRLAYGPGAIELVGLGLSAAGIAALGGLAGRRRRALRRVGA